LTLPSVEVLDRWEERRYLAKVPIEWEPFAPYTRQISGSVIAFSVEGAHQHAANRRQDFGRSACGPEVLKKTTTAVLVESDMR
jgi:hypothetical protein